jgi:hypothetical protein
MNTTTRAQRINKRQDAIWGKAIRTKAMYGEPFSYDGQGVIMDGNRNNRTILARLEPEAFSLAPLLVLAPTMFEALRRISETKIESMGFEAFARWTQALATDRIFNIEAS